MVFVYLFFSRSVYLHFVFCCTVVHKSLLFSQSVVYHLFQFVLNGSYIRLVIYLSTCYVVLLYIWRLVQKFKKKITNNKRTHFETFFHNKEGQGHFHEIFAMSSSTSATYFCHLCLILINDLFLKIAGIPFGLPLHKNIHFWFFLHGNSTPAPLTDGTPKLPLFRYPIVYADFLAKRLLWNRRNQFWGTLLVF